MQLRLIAGTINKRRDEDGWHNVHLDVSPREIWDHDLAMPVLPDVVCDLRDLGRFRTATFHEIFCHHVLEHLPSADVPLVLAGFNRVLVSNGVLDVEVPDLDRIVASYHAGEIDLAVARQWLLGEQLSNHEPSDSHRSAWTETALRALLVDAGFQVGQREETGMALRWRAIA